MAAWPTLGRVDDRRLAQALADGDPSSLAQIYDDYSARLFDYSHALLRDQQQSAGALHDTLIAAQQHIVRLQDPERFRSWLYTLVRNECLRRLGDPERPQQRQEAPEADHDTFLDAGERERREETRQIVHSALSGLTGRQRESVDLAIRHDLNAEELAGVLGLTVPQATDLLGEARSTLDNALAAAIIGRTGREDCPSVSALTDGAEWPLTADVCRKLIRHIESCPICSDRRTRKVSTDRMMQTLPVALVPADLRPAVLSLAEAPDGQEARSLIAQRAEPFDEGGWPTSVERSRPARTGRSTPRLWPAIAAAAAVLLVAGGLFLFLSGSSGSKPSDATTDAAAPGPGGSAPADPLTPEPTSPTKTPTHSPSPKPSSSTPAPHTTAPHTQARPSSRRQTPPRNPTPGTLTVSDNGSGTATLTAHGGAVSWTATDSKYVSASRHSGTLSAGQQTTVTLTAHDTEAACAEEPEIDNGSVSFSPGGSASVGWTCG